MKPFLAELLGTALLVLLGNGVVANVVLKQTKGHASGWLVITTGWALAVTFAVYCVNAFSGAHLNPAVTLALAAVGKLNPGLIPVYLAGQMIGAFLGATLVWLTYL
ncbi:MAG: MIP/aquaporin family protein, partial [Verrucomicrobiota bacterium]